MEWEYFDRMVVFSESDEGMVSGLDSWINGAGADGLGTGELDSVDRTQQRWRRLRYHRHPHGVQAATRIIRTSVKSVYV